jgi:hypothetical protein
MATTPPQMESIFEPGSASAKVDAELQAEASALGTAQGAAAMAASVDPTGLSSIPLMIGNNVANEAFRTKSNARLEAAQDQDLQATYRKYGMNPDGTPSGRPGPGSAPAN